MREGLTLIAMVVLVLLTIRWSFIGVLSLMLASVLRDTLIVETYGTFFTYHGIQVFYIATAVSVILFHPDRLSSFVPRGLTDWGMIGFLLALLISAALNGVDIISHKYIDLFFKAVVLYFLISRLVATPAQLVATVVTLIAATTYLTYRALSLYRAGYVSFARPYLLSSYHEFGLILVLTVPLIGAMAVQRRLWAPFRLVLICLLPVYLLAVLRTQSRSSMLGMFLALAMLGWHMRKRWYLLLPLVPLLAYAIAHNPDAVLNRLTSIWTHELEGVEDGSIRSRFEQMRTAQNIIKSNPIFGIGPRQFFVRYVDFVSKDDEINRTREVQYTMHSVPLLILCEEGLVGGLAFLLLVVGGLCSAYYVVKHTRGDPEMDAVAAVGAGSLMAFLAWLAYGLANPAMWVVNIYATIGLLTAARRVVAEHLATKAAEAPAATPAPVPWAVGAAGTTDIVFS